MSDYKIERVVRSVFNTDGRPRSEFDRESWVLRVGGVGAVEAWRTPRYPQRRYFGGVEVHLLARPSEDYFVDVDRCPVLSDLCWTHGAASAFAEVEALFDNPAAMADALMPWVRRYLLKGGAL